MSSYGYLYRCWETGDVVNVGTRDNQTYRGVVAGLCPVSDCDGQYIRVTLKRDVPNTYVTNYEADRYMKRTINVRLPQRYWSGLLDKELKALKNSLTFAKFVNRQYAEEEKPVKIRNRFYVAAPSVTTQVEQALVNTPENVRLATESGDRGGRWTRPTLKAALAHAEAILEQNPNQDHVAVVQIVRVVRRKKAPVVVEVVK